MNDIGGKERRFLDALESLFTGVQPDCQLRVRPGMEEKANNTPCR